MNKIKSLSIFIVIVIACILFSPLTVRAASQKAKIEKQALKLTEAASKYNRTQFLKYVDMQNSKNNFTYINDAQWNKYIKKIKKHDYADITKVKIKGKTATVYIELDTVSCYDILGDCISEAIQNDYSIDKTNKEIIKELKYFSKHWKDYQETYKLKIKYKKIGNKWVVSTVNKDLQFLFDSGATKVIKDFSKNPSSFLFR